MNDSELELYAQLLLEVWLDCKPKDMRFNWNIQTERRKQAWKRVARFMVERETDLISIRGDESLRALHGEERRQKYPNAPSNKFYP